MINAPDKMFAVPQADDLSKVFEVVSIVNDGYGEDALQLGDSLEVVERQGWYYAAAAEQLGLVEHDDKGWAVTSKGKRYLNDPTLARRRTIVMAHPLIKHLAESLGIQRVSYSTHHHLFEDDKFVSDAIEELGYAAATAYRRALTIRAWMKGLE